MAVAFDAVGPSSSGASSTSSATLSWTHTNVASGVDVVAAVAVDVASPDTGTTVTCTIGGTSATSLGKVEAGSTSSGYLQVFRLTGVASGAVTVTMTTSGNIPADMTGGSISFTGVSGISTPVTLSNSTANPSLNVTGVASTSMVAGFYGSGDTIGSPSGGGTSRFVNNLKGSSGAATGNAAGLTNTGTGTVAVGWTSISTSNALLGVEMQGVAAGPGPAMPSRPLRRDRRTRYRRWQWASFPAGMSVTATQGGSTQNGMLLRVKVLTGQAATQNGGTGTVSGATAGQVSVTTTQAGSLVYGAAIRASATVPSVNGVTAQLDGVSDATHTTWYGTWESSSVTGTPGATTFGYTATFTGSTAGMEVLPSGTLAEDPSGPPGVSTLTDITVQTAPFNPPPGSLLVAMVGADGGGAQTTMTVTGGGLTWTEVVKGNTAGDGYAGVWTAVVPGGATGPPPGVATLTALTAITAPAVQQLAPATLSAAGSITAPVSAQLAPATLIAAATVNAPAVRQLAPATLAAGMTITGPVSTQLAPATLQAAGSVVAPVSTLIQNVVTTLTAAWSLTSPAVQLAPATLQPVFAVNSPAVIQLVPATLAAAFTLTGPVSTLDAPATLAAAWSIAAPAVLLAPASVSAGFVITSPNSALAAPASMIITGSLTGSAGQGASLAAGFTLTSPAQQLAPATLLASFTISSPDVQDAPATLAAGLAVAAPDVSLRAPATLSAAASLTGVPTILAPATLAAQASITSPAQQLAPASLLSATSLNSPAVIQQAPALLAAGFVLSTLPPPQQGSVVLQPGWALTAAGIMIPLQVISGMRAGEPHTAWSAGQPHLAWSTGEAHIAWSAAEPGGTRYAAGDPHSAWAAGEPHS